MRILLTGGSGFLGSHLARSWHMAGHTVTLLLRPSSSLRRLAPLTDRLSVVRAADDLSIVAAVQAARPDVIVHTACAYGRAGETPLQLLDSNVRYGLLLLQAARDSGAAFVNTGSVLAPDVSAYALSKQQLSDWGQQLTGEGQAFINIRLQHMYGAGDDTSKFTTHVLHQCYHNAEVLPLTAGEQRRDFLHIDDVVSAYTAIINHLAQFSGYTDIDVGSGQAPTVREYVETVHRLCGSTTRLDFGALAYRPSEAMLCRADTSRLQTLGWQPQHTLESGLTQTIEQEFGG